MDKERSKILHLGEHCADPYKIHTKKISAGLRPVTQPIAELQEFSLSVNQKVCTNCLIKLNKLIDKSSSEDEMRYQDEPSGSGTCRMETFEEDAAIEAANLSMASIGESPVEKKRMKKSKAYAEKKVEKAQVAVARQLQFVSHHDISQTAKATERESTEEKQFSKWGKEMIDQLVKKFDHCETRSEKVLTLTALPASMTRRKTEQFFGASGWMVTKAKNVVKEKGILSLPNPKSRPFPQETITAVESFYLSDEVSRVMPGKNDYVTIRDTNGVKSRKQKYLVLCNLKEAYQRFKEKNPEIKISFSKFAELRPKECILVGAKGTHSVCVCTIHQNTKLMILGAKLDYHE